MDNFQSLVDDFSGWVDNFQDVWWMIFRVWMFDFQGLWWIIFGV